MSAQEDFMAWLATRTRTPASTCIALSHHLEISLKSWCTGKEQTGLLHRDRKRPDGASLIQWSNVKHLAGDVTMVDTCVDSHLTLNSSIAGLAASEQLYTRWPNMSQLLARTTSCLCQSRHPVSSTIKLRSLCNKLGTDASKWLVIIRRQVTNFSRYRWHSERQCDRGSKVYSRKSFRQTIFLSI